MVDILTTEELESKIKEFIELAEKFAEPYRQKIFEILLADYLRSKSPEIVPEVSEVAVPAVVPTPAPKFIIPIGVRAFLQQYSVPEDKIRKLFFIEGKEIHPTYQLKTTVVADAQIQLALMTALENALKPGGKFEFSIEAVRARCKEVKLYDQPNFNAIFKRKDSYFKSLKDEEHVELSLDGKAELADVILAITE